MDVGHARKVFLDGFLRNRTGFQLELPLVPLGELYGRRLEALAGDHGVSVRLTTGRPLGRAGRGRRDRRRGAPLGRGDRRRLRRPGRAVRPGPAASSPDGLRDRIPGLAGLGAMQASPITGVHLWFDRPVCPFDHVVTPGRLIQWVFNHTAIQGRSAPAPSRRGGDDRAAAPARGSTCNWSSAPRTTCCRWTRSRSATGARRAGRDLAVGAGGEAVAVVGRDRARGDVRGPAGDRGAAAPAADADRRPVPGRRLDRHRLAGDDGRGRPQRLSRRPGDPPDLDRPDPADPPRAAVRRCSPAGSSARPSTGRPGSLPGRDSSAAASRCGGRAPPCPVPATIAESGPGRLPRRAAGSARSPEGWRTQAG